MASKELEKFLQLKEELVNITNRLKFINEEIRSLLNGRVNSGTTGQNVHKASQQTLKIVKEEEATRGRGRGHDSRLLHIIKEPTDS